MKIGFIGLGNMGSPMAANLAKAGYDVFGFDIEEKSIANVKIVNNIEKSILDMDIVITMLSDGSTVKDVSKEIISKLVNNKTFIDCSTIDVKTTIHVGENCKKADINFIDAPLFLFKITVKKTTPYKSAESANSALPKKSNCNSILSPPP